MDEYAGRVLAGRYRLPRPPADEFELVETHALDTYSGQQVLVRQLLLPETVPAELDGAGPAGEEPAPGADPAGRALAAAQAAAALPDHPRLVQVFDVLTEDGSLWVVSELVPTARPVAALLAQEPLTPYRAAELGADLLTGLFALHVNGWAHRNITTHTVLVCEDGRAMLDGLAFGAAQDALCGYDPVPQEVPAGPGGDAPPASGGWDGSGSALAMERARQARMNVVGPVTERWSPEQAAAPAPGNWQLAPPVGPAADLWALGALLFRCVQGHAVFPEESAAELVHLVCAEPAAHAEECGPLRPVVESLLRPDPAERPDFEEVRGWLRSLVRCAPEPDLGRAVSVPAEPDAGRLPIVRRKGEVVRQRKQREKADRAAAKAAARSGGTVPPPPARDLVSAGAGGHGRHARARHQSAPARPSRDTRAPASLDAVGLGGSGGYGGYGSPRTEAAPAPAPRRGRGRRVLGWFAVLVVLALAGLVGYALLFGPHRHIGAGRSLPAEVSAGGSPHTGRAASAPATTAPRTTAKATPAAPKDTPKDDTPPLAVGFALRHDPAGFTVAVHDGWTRSAGAHGGATFASGGDAFRLTVVSGRPADASDSSLRIYGETREPELADFRASNWTSYAGGRDLTVDGSPAYQEQFTWTDPHSGDEMYGANLVVQRGSRLDVMLLSGPDDQRQLIDQYFAQSVDTFRSAR